MLERNTSRYRLPREPCCPQIHGTMADKPMVSEAGGDVIARGSCGKLCVDRAQLPWSRPALVCNRRHRWHNKRRGSGRWHGRLVGSQRMYDAFLANVRRAPVTFSPPLATLACIRIKSRKGWLNSDLSNPMRPEYDLREIPARRGNSVSMETHLGTGRNRQAATLFLIAPMIAVSIAPPAPPAMICETMPLALRLLDCAAAMTDGSNNVTI